MTTKVRPNDLCPCGSGKKYKKCCFTKVSRAPKAPLFKRRNKAVKTQQEIERLRPAMAMQVMEGKVIEGKA